MDPFRHDRGSLDRQGSNLSSRGPTTPTFAQEAAILSQASEQACAAAKSILLSGGNQDTALSTARAAAQSVMNPNGSASSSVVGGSKFLSRRKAKRQAEVIASMALVKVTNELNMENKIKFSESTIQASESMAQKQVVQGGQLCLHGVESSNTVNNNNDSRIRRSPTAFAAGLTSPGGRVRALDSPRLPPPSPRRNPHLPPLTPTKQSSVPREIRKKFDEEATFPDNLSDFQNSFSPKRAMALSRKDQGGVGGGGAVDMSQHASRASGGRVYSEYFRRKKLRENSMSGSADDDDEDEGSVIFSVESTKDRSIPSKIMEPEPKHVNKYRGKGRKSRRKHSKRGLRTSSYMNDSTFSDEEGEEESATVVTENNSEDASTLDDTYQQSRYTVGTVKSDPSAEESDMFHRNFEPLFTSVAAVFACSGPLHAASNLCAQTKECTADNTMGVEESETDNSAMVKRESREDETRTMGSGTEYTTDRRQNDSVTPPPPPSVTEHMMMPHHPSQNHHHHPHSHPHTNATSHSTSNNKNININNCHNHNHHNPSPPPPEDRPSGETGGSTSAEIEELARNNHRTSSRQGRNSITPSQHSGHRSRTPKTPSPPLDTPQSEMEKIVMGALTAPSPVPPGAVSSPALSQVQRTSLGDRIAMSRREKVVEVSALDTPTGTDRMSDISSFSRTSRLRRWMNRRKKGELATAKVE